MPASQIQPGHSGYHILPDAKQDPTLPTSQETDACDTSLLSLPRSLYLRCFLPVPWFLSSQKLTEGCHMLRGDAFSQELKSQRSLFRKSPWSSLACILFVSLLFGWLFFYFAVLITEADLDLMNARQRSVTELLPQHKRIHLC